MDISEALDAMRRQPMLHHDGVLGSAYLCARVFPAGAKLSENHWIYRILGEEVYSAGSNAAQSSGVGRLSTRRKSMSTNLRWETE